MSWTLRRLHTPADPQWAGVLEGMRATLHEVLGPRAEAILAKVPPEARAAWHLEPAHRAELWIAEGPQRALGGHAFWRCATPEDLAITGLAGPWAQLGSIYVWPQARSLGLARRLWAQAEAWALAEGCHGLATLTHPENRPLQALAIALGCTLRPLTQDFVCLQRHLGGVGTRPPQEAPWTASGARQPQA